MKRFTKIALSFAAFFAVIGIAAIICAFAMGLTWNEFIGMAENGELAIQMGDSDNKITFFKHEEHSNHEHQSCRELDVEISAGTLNIHYDDVDEIEVEQEGVKNFSSRMDGDTLEISGGKGIISDGSKGVITITIPIGTSFDEVDLSLGAGQAHISGLCAENVNIEVGAGQAEIVGLDTRNLDAETGTGQITAELVGSETDYSYDVECGIGEIVIGEKSFGGLGKEQKITNPGSERFMDVECGIGQVTIKFQD